MFKVKCTFVLCLVSTNCLVIFVLLSKRMKYYSFLVFCFSPSLLYPNSFVSYRLKSETNIISLYTIWWWYKVIKNGLKNKNKKRLCWLKVCGEIIIEGCWPWQHKRRGGGDSSSFCFIFGGGGGGCWLPQHWLTLVHLKSSMLNRNCLSFFLLFLEKKSFPPLFFHHHNNRWNRCSPCTPYIPFYKTLWSYNSVSNHCRKLHFGN